MFNRLLNSIPWIRRWRMRRAMRQLDAISFRTKIWEFQRQLEDKQKAHLEARGSRAMRQMLDDIQEWQAAEKEAHEYVKQFANLIAPEQAAQEREQAEREAGVWVRATEPDDGSQRYLQRLRDEQAADIRWPDGTLHTFPPAFRAPQRLFELLRQLPSFSRLTNEQLARLVERLVFDLDRWATCLSLHGVQGVEMYLDSGLVPSPSPDMATDSSGSWKISRGFVDRLALSDSDGEVTPSDRTQAEQQQLYYQLRRDYHKKADDKQRSLPPQPWPGLCDCGHWYDD